MKPRRSKDGLDSAFNGEMKIFAPRYRRSLVELLLLVSLCVGLAYAEMNLLTRIVCSLTNSPDCTHGHGSLLWMLTLFAAVALTRVATSYFQCIRREQMNARAMIDLEKEVLHTLFQQDATFYSRHALQEIVSRLVRDVIRVIDRRAQFVVLVAAFAELAVIFLYFLQEESTFAIVVAVCSAASAWLVMRTTRSFTAISEELYELDERNCVLLEQYLRATPEIQLAQVFERAQTPFKPLRAMRLHKLYVRGRRKAWRLGICPMIEALTVIFVLLLIGILLGALTGDAPAVAGLTAGAAFVTLLPTIIRQIPVIFRLTGEITEGFSRLQLAAISLRRLLAYDRSHPNHSAQKQSSTPDPAPASTSKDLKIDSASFRYPGPDNLPQGGISDVRACFFPGQFWVVVGGSGSGKSTLIQLLLGRLRTQGGNISYDGLDWWNMGEHARASLLAYLPQHPVIVQGSLADNVLLTSPASSIDQLPASAREWLQLCGLASICRQRAIDDAPADGIKTSQLDDLRQLIAGRFDAESLLGDPQARMGAGRWSLPLGQWLPDASGQALQIQTTAGREILEATAALLQLPSFEEFAALAPLPVEQRVWKLRRSLLHNDSSEPKRWQEFGATVTPLEWTTISARPSAKTAAELRDAFGSITDLPAEPSLGRSWREHLLAEIPPVSRSRDLRRRNEILLDVIERHPLGEVLLLQGLQSDAGVSGARLSGGQAQILALARALVREAPILVVDEPSSALDPIRARMVARCLQEYRSLQRTVICVTHDETLVAAADQVLWLDRGNMVAAGTPSELASSHPSFRDLFPSCAPR